MKKNNIYFGEEEIKNKPLIRRKILLGALIIWTIIVSYIFTFIGGYNKCKENDKAEIASYKEEIYYDIFEGSADEEYFNPYIKPGNVFSLDFQVELDNEKIMFITKLAKKLNIDPGFCICILYQENNVVNTKAISKKNPNGTRDLGMWQLNSGCIEDFKKMFWKFDIEFDPYDWKHSTWIALHLIQDLYNEFGDYKKVAQGYNGGAYRVRKNTVVPKAVSYSEIVMETYNSLKEERKCLAMNF